MDTDRRKYLREEARMKRHEHTRECGFCDRVLRTAVTYILPVVAALLVLFGCITYVVLPG